LILIVLDITKPLMHKKVRLNKLPPELTVMRKDKGGLRIVGGVPKLSDETVSCMQIVSIQGVPHTQC